MKRIIVIVAVMLTSAVLAFAQPRAIGIRAGYGAELSYQHTLGSQNFLEVDLGWSAGFVDVSAAYDFQIAPVGPLDFFAGPQLSLGIANGGGVMAGAGAQLGLEYLFDQIPLQLSLDWKPTFIFVPQTAFGWQTIALGIRYRF